MEDLELNIDNLEELIGYDFRDRTMAAIAVFHPGLNRCDKTLTRKFERLEFLGDRVLGLALADFLYRNFDDETAGELAVRIATLAGTDFLISLAKKTKIIKCFHMPKDFFVSGNKNSSSIADMTEAVFGAVFLDSDFRTSQRIIANLLDGEIDNVIYKTKDAKTRLQEIVQTQTTQLPVYRLIKTVGEAHDPIFEMEVSACGETAVGHGNSKRNAEHDAAEKIIDLLEAKSKHQRQ